MTSTGSQSSETVTIGKRSVGGEHPCFIVAELSANHGGKFELAEKTLRAAREAGADAIKLQTYTADSLTLDIPRDPFVVKGGTPWDGRTFYDLYLEAHTPWEWQPKLMALAEELGMICFSSPFDLHAVEFLERLHVPAYKIASFEITDLRLIRSVAAKGKPVIISTGIADIGEIDRAVKTCQQEGNHQIALLKCTSAYPAALSDMNLRTIPNLQETFGTVVGLSDHSLGSSAAIASIALGAKIIEKHFILDRSLGGPDASFSLEPAEFSKMVTSVREVEEALGKVSYSLTEKERKNRVFARSLWVTKDVRAGEKVTEENVRSLRPSNGLAPSHYDAVIGRTFRQPVARGTPLSWSLIE